MMPTRTEARAILLIGALAFTSMYALLSAGPLLVAEGIGQYGAGIATTVFMSFTIAAQFATPLGLRAIPPAWLLAASLLLLGIPALVYAVTDNAWVLVGAGAIRGIGFGLMTIVCTTLVSLYAPAGKQGAALGIYGLSTSITGILAPGLGVFLLEAVGRWAPAAIAALAPLAGLLWLTVIHRASPHPVSQRANSAEASGRGPSTLVLLSPLVAFVPAAIAYGMTYTFLPLFSELAALGLLMIGCGFALGRIVGGRLADRHRAAAIVTAFGVVTAAGLVFVAWLPGVWGACSAIVLGFGIGGCASSSLAGMMAAVEPSRYGFVSTAWNLSFDLGIAVGGLGLGAVIAVGGFLGGSVFLALVVLAALMLAVWPLSRLVKAHGPSA